MQLTVVLEQGEDGYIVVSCPALPGCRTQGKTESEALVNIREAIAAWLLTANDRQHREAARHCKRRTVEIVV